MILDCEVEVDMVDIWMVLSFKDENRLSGRDAAEKVRVCPQNPKVALAGCLWDCGRQHGFHGATRARSGEVWITECSGSPVREVQTGGFGFHGFCLG